MGLINSIKDKIYTKENKKSIYLSEDGTPKTVVRSRKSPIFDFTNHSGRSKALMNKFYNYYLNESTIWAAINSIAFNTVMVGYNLDSDDSKSLKIIKDFCTKTNIDSVVLQSTTNALVLGDAFIEIIYNKGGQPTRLKNVDPKTMTINYDNHGDVSGYVQEVGKKKINIKPKYICHIKLFDRPDSPYGISLIEPSLSVISKKVRTDNAVANSIIRHGMSKYVVTVGKSEDGELPPESVLTQIKADLKDIDERNEFIIPWNVEIKTIDNKGVEGVQDYYNYFQTQMVIGLLCPEESLGLGAGSTAATATVKAILYERMINSFQNKISRAIEHDIFNKVLTSNDIDENTISILFNNVTEQDEAMRAKWTGDLMKGFRTSNVKPFTINEVRAMFGKKPIDIPEANTLMYGEQYIEDDDKEDMKDELSDAELDILISEKQNALYDRKIQLIKRLEDDLDEEK